MNPPDEFTTLLAELGTATPDPCFEQRVLHGIQSHVQSRQLQPAEKRPRWFLAVGLASALATGAVLFALFVHRVPAPQVLHAHRLPPPAVPARPAPESQLAETPVHRRPRVANPPEAGEDAALLSFPAPPAPLTEQEQLLLRLVHKRDPVQEAMLRPDSLPLEEARAREEFLRFFPPSGPPPNDVPPPLAIGPKSGETAVPMALPTPNLEKNDQKGESK